MHSAGPVSEKHAKTNMNCKQDRKDWKKHQNQENAWKKYSKEFLSIFLVLKFTPFLKSFVNAARLNFSTVLLQLSLLVQAEKNYLWLQDEQNWL